MAASCWDHPSRRPRISSISPKRPGRRAWFAEANGSAWIIGTSCVRLSCWAPRYPRWSRRRSLKRANSDEGIVVASEFGDDDQEASGSGAFVHHIAEARWAFLTPGVSTLL